MNLDHTGRLIMFSKISFRSGTDKEMFIENVCLLCPTKKVNFWLSSQTRTGCYNKVVEKRRKSLSATRLRRLSSQLQLAAAVAG